MTRLIAAIHPRFRVRVFIAKSIGLGFWFRRRVVSASIGPIAIYLDWTGRVDPYEQSVVIRTPTWEHRFRGLNDDERSMVWMLAEAGVDVVGFDGWWYR